MRHGLIKAATASPAIRVADVAYNTSQIASCMKQACEEGVHLLVLPELCVTGYTCGDLFLQQPLLQKAREALLELAWLTKRYKLVAVVGAPLECGGKLYNCAVMLCGGSVLGIVPKAHVPNYGEFYEARHFSPAPPDNGSLSLGELDVPFGPRLLFQCDVMPELTLALEVCEDLWVPHPPSADHAVAGATVIANCSASNEAVGKAAYRRELVRSQSARCLCAYLYADAGQGESTSDLVFSGHGLLCENGALLAESPLFGPSPNLAVTELDLARLLAERRRMSTFPAACAQGYQTLAFHLPLADTVLTRPVSPTPFVPAGREEQATRCGEILSMQAGGLKKRLTHTGLRTAVIGVSGGLDSTLALLVTVRAFDELDRPRSDILAVTMPCFGTTQRTRGNAELLCEALGVPLRCVDITDSVRQHFADIGHDEQVRDATYENAQARERTQVLMDLANQSSGLVIGTGDLSELALGWATYNGDHMSMYGVNASIPKTLVRSMVSAYAESCGLAQLAAVLRDIVDTPVSPELLPAQEDEITQKTEDLVGPYELHDFFLYHILRWGESPAKVLRLAEYAFQGKYGRPFILSWLKVFYRRFFAQQFKRSCLPDGPKVGSVSLSPRGDWRMPSDACATLWLEELELL